MKITITGHFMPHRRVAEGKTIVKWDCMICEVVAVDVSKHIVYDKKCVLCGCVKMRKISLWEFVFNKKKMTGLLMVSLTFCCIMYFIYEHRSVVAFYPVHVKGLIFFLHFLKYKLTSDAHRPELQYMYTCSRIWQTLLFKLLHPKCLII